MGSAKQNVSCIIVSFDWCMIQFNARGVSHSCFLQRIVPVVLERNHLLLCKFIYRCSHCSVGYFVFAIKNA